MAIKTPQYGRITRPRGTYLSNPSTAADGALGGPQGTNPAPGWTGNLGFGIPPSIREFLPLHRKRPVNEVINLAMNDTLSRTLNTGVTSILVLIAMFFLGGATIRGFLFAMIIGIIVGTYSSIFVASAIVYDTSRKTGIKY